MVYFGIIAIFGSMCSTFFAKVDLRMITFFAEVELRKKLIEKTTPTYEIEYEFYGGIQILSYKSVLLWLSIIRMNKLCLSVSNLSL